MAEEIDHGGWEFACGPQLFGEGVELGAVREFAVPEQVNGLLETGAAGDFVDVVSRVDEDALLAEHIAEVGGVGDDSFESFCCEWHGVFFWFAGKGRGV